MCLCLSLGFVAYIGLFAFVYYGVFTWVNFVLLFRGVFAVVLPWCLVSFWGVFCPDRMIYFIVKILFCDFVNILFHLRSIDFVDLLKLFRFKVKLFPKYVCVSYFIYYIC